MIDVSQLRMMVTYDTELFPVSRRPKDCEVASRFKITTL